MGKGSMGKELSEFLVKSGKKLKSAGKEVVADGLQAGKKAVEKHGGTAGKVALGAAGGAAAAAAASDDDDSPPKKKKKRAYMNSEGC